MNDLRDLLQLTRKKPVRFGILLLSTLVIISASGLVYSGMTTQTPLNVGGPAGVAGSTSAGLSLSPDMTVVLAVSAFAISLSIFGILHLASTRAVARSESRSVSLTPVSVEKEWEESPRKDEGEE